MSILHEKKINTSLICVLKLFIFVICVHICVCESLESVLSHHLVDSRDQNWVISSTHKVLYPWSHLVTVQWTFVHLTFSFLLLFYCCFCQVMAYTSRFNNDKQIVLRGSFGRQQFLVHHYPVANA